LLSHAKLSETKELAQKFPEFDVILSAGGPEEPVDEPEMIGKTMLVTVGAKGKHIGVLGYYPESKTQRLRFESVDLDNQRFNDTPQMFDLMRGYQERLGQEQILEKMAEHPIPHDPSGATYVGAAKCGECHTKAFAKWSTTNHSHAFETLE